MPSFKSIGLLVLEKKIFKVFAIYSHGGNLGHVTLTIYTNFHSLFLRMLHIKFGFDWPSGFSSSSSKEWQFYVMPGQTDLIHVPTTRTFERFQRRCLNIMVIYMYIAPGQGRGFREDV